MNETYLLTFNFCNNKVIMIIDFILIKKCHRFFGVPFVHWGSGRVPILLVHLNCPASFEKTIILPFRGSVGYILH